MLCSAFLFIECSLLHGACVTYIVLLSMWFEDCVMFPCYPCKKFVSVCEAKNTENVGETMFFSYICSFFKRVSIIS